MISKNILLDTNIIIRHLLNDNKELSPKADEIFDKIKLGDVKACITKYIFTEVIFVLQNVYKIPPREISETMTDLLNIKNIVIEEKSILLRALRIYSNSKLSIVDSLLIEDAEHLNYDIQSFDKDLIKNFKCRIYISTS